MAVSAEFDIALIKLIYKCRSINGLTTFKADLLLLCRLMGLEIKIAQMVLHQPDDDLIRLLRCQLYRMRAILHDGNAPLVANLSTGTTGQAHSLIDLIDH